MGVGNVHDVVGNFAHHGKRVAVILFICFPSRWGADSVLILCWEPTSERCIGSPPVWVLQVVALGRESSVNARNYHELPNV